MSDKQVGYGVVGWGSIAKVHTLALRAIPVVFPDAPLEVKQVAVVTRHPVKNGDAIRRAGYERAVDALNSLLHDPRVQAVDICTPNHLHVEQVAAAWRTGKSVYCEKPLAESYAAAERLSADLDAAWPGLVHASQVAFVLRFLPAVARAKDAIAAGAIGEVLSFRARMIHGGYLSPALPMSWRLDQSLSGGGALADLGVHLIDMVRFVLGDVAEIDARTRTFVAQRIGDHGRHARVEVDDWGEITCTLAGAAVGGCAGAGAGAGAAVGTIEASRSGDGQEETTLEVFGREGSLRITTASPYTPTWYTRQGGKLVVRDDRFPWDGPHTRAVQSVYPTPKLSLGSMVDPHLASLYWWLRKVATGGVFPADQRVDPAANISDGLAAQAVLQRAYESAASKQRV